MIDLPSRNQFATEVKQRIKDLACLPPMPEVARELLMLRNRDGEVEQLAALIERDPSLSAQLVRYARAPAYGYGDRIASVAHAIMLVLGYDKAMNLALALSAGQTLKMPAAGPLGRKAFWLSSLKTANLSLALANKVARAQRPNPGTCYLAGLMHDFGQLVFAHLYPQHYALLSKLYAIDPTQDLRELELSCFGVSHDYIGMWLMRAWDMPEEVIVAVSESFFPDYDGEFAIYAKVVALAASHHRAATPSEQALERLGIQAVDFNELTAVLGDAQDQLEDFAAMLAA